MFTCLFCRELLKGCEDLQQKKKRMSLDETNNRRLQEAIKAEQEAALLAMRSKLGTQREDDEDSDDD